MGKHFRHEGLIRSRFFSERLKRNRIKTERLLGGARRGGNVYNIEHLEPRLLLAAQLLSDAPNDFEISDYIGDPTLITGMSAQVEALITDAFEALDVIEDTIDSTNTIEIDLPGLLDREPAGADGDSNGEHDEVAMDELFDIAGQLAATSGFTIVGDANDIDLSQLDFFDYDGSGDINLTEVLRNAFQGQLNTILSDGADLDDVIAAINSISNVNLSLGDPDLFSGTADYVLEIHAGNLGIVLDSGSEYDLTFDLGFSISRTDIFSFDPGRNADLLGFSYGADQEGNVGLPQINLDSTFSFDTTVKVDMTLVESINDNGTPDDGDPDNGDETLDDFTQLTVSFTNGSDIGIQDTEVLISSGASTALSSFDLQIGFLDIVATGQFDLNADVAFSMPALTSLTALGSFDAGDVTLSTDGDFAATLTITADLAGAPAALADLQTTYTGISGEVTLTADPFNDAFGAESGSPDHRTAPSIAIDSDFETYFTPWVNVNANALLTFISQFRSFVFQFQNSPDLFGFDVPFADGMSLLGDSMDAADDLLDWATPIQDMIDALFTFDPVTSTDQPNFDSIQSLAALGAFTGELLGTALPDLVFAGGDMAAPQLLIGFSFDNATSFTQELDLGFNFGNLANFGVTAASNMQVDANLALSFLFGVDLADAAAVEINSNEVGLGLISQYSGAGTNAVNLNLTNSARFKLKVNGVPAFEVTVAAGNYADIGALAAAVQSAVNTAIGNAGLDPEDIPTILVSDIQGDRLSIRAPAQTLLTIELLDDGNANDFANLGFDDGQVANNSRVPENGILSGTASFDLYVDSTMYAISLGANPGGDNATATDILLDLQAAIDSALGGAGIVEVGQDADGNGGFTLRLLDATKTSIRVDGTNSVAQLELGLVDDAVASRIQLVGDRALDNGGFTPETLPANGQLGSNLELTVTIDGVAYPAVTVFAADTTDNATASDLIRDIRDALQTVEVSNGVTLAEFFEIDANSSDELVISSFFEPVDSIVIQESGVAPFVLSTTGTISLGLLEGIGVDGQFETTAFNPASVTFNIEVTDLTGAVTTETITINEAGNTSLADVIDDFNAAIGATSFSGDLIAGLNGGRVSLSAITDQIRSIRVSQLSTSEEAVTGLSSGASAVAPPASGAFVADVALTAGVTGVASGSGSVDLGFLGIDFGTISGGASITVGGELRGGAVLGQTNALALETLFDAASGTPGADSLSLLQQLGLDGARYAAESGVADPGDGLGISVSGSASVEFGGLSVSGSGGVLDQIDDYIQNTLITGLGLTPTVTVAVADILTFNPADILNPVLDDLNEIGSFLDFSFGEVQQAFNQAGEFLEGLMNLDFLGTPLPFVGLDLSEALGFVDGFNDVIGVVMGQSVETVQDLSVAILAALEQIGVSNPGNLGITFDVNSPAVLGFDIDWGLDFGGILPLNFSLTDLGVPEAFAEIANITGSANVAANFAADVGLSFGVDITNPLDGLTINTDQTGISITGVAEATEVSFIAALGPLAALIDGGAISLGGTGPQNTIFSFDLSELVGSTIDLDALLAGGTSALSDLLDDIKDTFNGVGTDVFNFGFDVALPVYVQFGGASTFIGNLSFDALVDGFDDLGFFLGDLGQGVSLVDDIFSNLTLPDFDLMSILFGEDFLDNLSLLDTIQLFVEGLDLIFGTLGDVFSGELFGLDGIGDIPFVGDAFDSAADFFDDIRNEVISPLATLIDETPEILAGIFNDILGVLNDTIGSFLDTVGFGSQFVINFLDDAGNILESIQEGVTDNVVEAILDNALLNGFEVTFDLGGQYGVGVGDVDFGIPAFGLDVEGELTVGFIWQILFGIGVNLTDGLYLAVQEDPEISLEAFLSLPDNTQLTLGFLAVTADNQNINGPFDPFLDPAANDLYGLFAFDIDASGNRIGIANIPTIEFDVQYGVAIDLQLGLEFSLGGVIPAGTAAAFPSLLAEVGFQWAFGDQTFIGASGLPDMPEISFDRLGLQLGSFLTDVLSPVVDFVQTYIDPILPLINLLIDPIPVISDLNGEVSLLDIAAQFGLVNQGLVTAIEIIVGIANSLNGLDVSAEEITLWIVDNTGGAGVLSSFTLGGDGADAVDLTNPANIDLFQDPSQTFGSILSAIPDLSEIAGFIGGGTFDSLLSGAVGGASAGNSGAFNLLTGGGGGAGLVFPFLEDPTQIFGLLFQRDATLIGLDLPPLVFGFDYSQFFSIWGPIGVTLGGAFSATFDFDVAFDTAGIRKFAAGGFDNPLDLFEGFYFLDDSFENPGVDTPEITLYGEITAALAISIGIASAGVGGGIFGTFAVDWHDPNGDLKMRFSEIFANVEANDGNIFCIFDYSVLLEAKLFVFVEALFGLWEKRWEFGPSLPLIDETIVCNPDPLLATADPDAHILRLNMGDFSEDRTFTGGGVTLDDVDEEFFVFEQGGDVWVEARIGGVVVSAQNYGAASQYDLIIARAGAQADAVYMDGTRIGGGTSGVVTIAGDLQGGEGDDTLVGGSAQDLILGEAGADLLKGGASADVIRGGSGNDRIKGDGGADQLFGELGDDTILGGAGNDTIDGDVGADVLGGGDDNDTVWGREGNDLISGGGGSDTLSGGVGDDTIWGDLEFTFDADCYLQTTGGLPDMQAATSAHGGDFIAGGADNDWVSADGGDDRVWGDSDFVAQADGQTIDLTGSLLIVDDGEGATGNTVISLNNIPRTMIVSLNRGGADTISGGADNDVILGEDGNDVLRGDLFDDLADPDDRFFAGLSVDAAGDAIANQGNDIMVGARGADVIFGSGGNDWGFGGSGTDFLIGNDGNDSLRGAAGRDVLFGDDGLIDIFETGESTRVLDGGAASVYDAPTFDPQSLASANPTVGGNDNLLGGIDDDVIFGGAGADVIDGQSGRELIFGDHGLAEFTFEKQIGAAIMTFATTTDSANGGNDTIEGGLGEDIIFGGTASDTVNGDLADDGVTPQSNDVILGDFGEMNRILSIRLKRGAVADITTSTAILPGAGDYGDDIITGGGGADVIFGGLGSDKLLGGKSGDPSGDGEYRDIIVGDDGWLSYIKTDADILTSVDGNDLFGDNDHVDPGLDAPAGPLNLTLDIVETLVDVAAGAADTISGGEGDDIILGGGGGDTVYGDDVFDLVSLVVTPTSEADSGIDTVIGDQGLVALTGALVRVIRSTAASDAEGGGDMVFGNYKDDVIIGGVSNGATDELHGEDGNDMIIGDEGIVLLTWDAGLNVRDRIFSTSFSLGGVDLIFGGKGDDIGIGGSGADTIQGDNDGGFEPDFGNDLLIGDQGEIDYVTVGAIAELNTVDSTDTSDADGGADLIEGDGGSDIIIGGVLGDMLYGEASNHALSPMGNSSYDDVILGDEGTVFFRAEEADELVETGGLPDSTTIDKIVATDETLGGADTIAGNRGNDVLIGGVDADHIYGDNFETTPLSGVFDGLETLSGDDIAIGDQGQVINYTGLRDIIETTDTTTTDGGADTIEGNDGSDLILGGVEGDLLYGEAPSLALMGNAGLFDDAILGDEGEVLYRVTDSDSTTIDEIRSDAFDGVPILGGNDLIFGNRGSDIAIGGTGADQIFGDNLPGVLELMDGDDILIGDQGEVILLAGVLDYLQSTDNEAADGDGDLIEGNDGNDIIIGGVGSDTLHGEADDQSLVEDNGQPVLGGFDDIILGDEGFVDYDETNANNRERVEIRTERVDLGAGDIILGNRGADVALGGTGNDIIHGDVYWAAAALVAVGNPNGEDNRDILVGDHGQLLYDDQNPFNGVVNTDASYLSTLRTIDPGEGGQDFITGDDGDDVILGGFDNDRLYGEHTFDRLADLVASRAGDDIMLGDNGQLDFGLDVIAMASSGIFASTDPDLSTLDRVMTTDPTLGGSDLMFGNGGSDAMMGGTFGDQMWGDSGDGLVDNSGVPTDLGAPDVAGIDGADGNDLMFGDHGALYAELAELAAVGTGVKYNDFFLAKDTQFADLGGDDMMLGNGANDIMLGQQGDDVMFGGTGDDDLIGGHNVAGGIDEQDGGLTAADYDLGPLLADMTPVDNDDLNDIMDGGDGTDVLAGDNAIVVRQNNSVSPRFHQVGAGGEMYNILQIDLGAQIGVPGILIDTGIQANINAVDEANPDHVAGRTVTILDHSKAIQDAAAADPASPHVFGNDVMAGGSGDDEMWGQLGDDIMQGDGLIQLTHTAGVYSPLQGADPSYNLPSEYLVFNTDEATSYMLTFRVLENAATDGDDYMEGNGGNDRMYGNLGSDDMIGGSSSLFGLGEFSTIADPARPDGADLMYGAAGDAARLLRNAQSGEDNGFDSDVMIGDNGNIYRLVDDQGEYRTFNYDQSQTDRIVPRPVDLLDYGYSPVFDEIDPIEGIGVFSMTDLLGVTGFGAGDLMYGEAGDDFMHGQTGDDVMFGNSHNDSMHGERGNDIMFGGTGEDGMLGDDGLLAMFRVPAAGQGNNNEVPIDEPLWGFNPDDGEEELILVEEEISTPGNLQRSIINLEGELHYVVDLLAFRTGTDGTQQQFNDIMFGGLHSDWMHGGDGDDAMSGAEALEIFYHGDGSGTPFTQINSDLIAQQNGTGLHAAANPEQPNPFWFDFAIYNPGEILRHEGKMVASGGGNGNFGNVSAEFAAYDSYNPRDRVYIDPATGLSVPIADLTGNEIEFILNFNNNEGPTEQQIADSGASTYLGFPDPDGLVDLWNDGNDRMFGDLGNDWIVGGTGRDNMYGGRGNDLLNMDDDHDTNGGLNDDPDAYQAYADIAYGGAGRDILILNTGADRSIDWVGEFNSYIVPFSPFGAFHISRSLQPHLAEYLLDLSASDGADQTAPDLGLYLEHKYADAKTYDPDPMRNFEPFGELGMVRQQDFDWGDQTGAPADPQAGNMQGKREIMRRALFGDEPLQGGGGGGGNNGQGQGFAPTAGSWLVSDGLYNAQSLSGADEAVSLFFLEDQQPSYLELLATVNMDKDKAGWGSNAYIVFDYQDENNFKFAGVNASTDKIEIGVRTVDGWNVLTQSNMQLKSDSDYDLKLVMHGTVATIYVNGGKSTSYNFSDPLNDGYIGLGVDGAKARFDDWQVQKLPPVITFENVSTFDAVGDTGDLLPQTGLWSVSGGTLDATIASGFALAAQPIDVAIFSMLEVETTFDGTALAGIVFDYYSETEFKFAGIDPNTDQVVIGHSTSRGIYIDVSVDVQLNGNGTHELTLRMLGTGVSVELDGTAVVGHVYDAILNDGGVGVFVESGAASFEEVIIRGDDPAYAADAEALSAADFDGTGQVAADELLTEADLRAVATVAIEIWAKELGVTVAELGISVDDFQIADLGGANLALENDGTIFIDADAAGRGWFVDETPQDDAEFQNGDGPEGYDLLSALLHEIGHALEYDHSTSGTGTVMDPTLSEGQRLTFTTADAGFVDVTDSVEDNEPDGPGIDWGTTPSAAKTKTARPGFLFEFDDLDGIARDPFKIAAE